jgi:hypothetical protein
MKPLATALASLVLALATTLAASAQVQQGVYPPYRPGTSTWRAGPPQAGAGHSLLNRPHPWMQTARPFPLIDASFKHPLQTSSVRITLDGRNVTAIAQIRSGGFEFTPARPLALGTHTVRVVGL